MRKIIKSRQKNATKAFEAELDFHVRNGNEAQAQQVARDYAKTQRSSARAIKDFPHTRPIAANICDKYTSNATQGGWNADIASPSGVSGNLLRIAKTVETLSSTISGGDSPLITDFNANLKSLGVLATQLNSSSDLADDTGLKTAASSALTSIVSNSALVQSPPTAARRAELVGSLEQAVQGITDNIRADGVVVEDPTLLAKIEKVLEEASIADTVSVTLSMGGGNLNFGAVITEIEMSWNANILDLTAVVPDDDPNSIDYNWSITPSVLSLDNPNAPLAQVSNFDGSNLRVSLTVIDTAASNFTDTRSCTWQTNPTVCEF